MNSLGHIIFFRQSCNRLLYCKKSFQGGWFYGLTNRVPASSFLPIFQYWPAGTLALDTDQPPPSQARCLEVQANLVSFPSQNGISTSVWKWQLNFWSFVRSFVASRLKDFLFLWAWFIAFWCSLCRATENDDPLLFADFHVLQYSPFWFMLDLGREKYIAVV